MSIRIDETLFQSYNHLIQPTFDALDHESLASCINVSTFWNAHLSPILANPIFIQNRRAKMMLEVRNTMEKLHSLFFSPIATGGIGHPNCGLFHTAFPPQRVVEILNPATFDYGLAISFIIEKIESSIF